MLAAAAAADETPPAPPAATTTTPATAPPPPTHHLERCPTCARDAREHLAPLCDPRHWHPLMEANTQEEDLESGGERLLIAALKEIAARHGAFAVAEEWTVAPPGSAKGGVGDLFLRLSCGTDVAIEAKWLCDRSGATARKARSKGRNVVRGQAQRYALLWRAKKPTVPLVLAAILTNEHPGPVVVMGPLLAGDVSSLAAMEQLPVLPSAQRAAVARAAAAMVAAAAGESLPPPPLPPAPSSSSGPPTTTTPTTTTTTAPSPAATAAASSFLEEELPGPATACPACAAAAVLAARELRADPSATPSATTPHLPAIDQALIAATQSEADMLVAAAAAFDAACPGAVLLRDNWLHVDGWPQGGKGDLVYRLPCGTDVALEVGFLNARSGKTACRARTKIRGRLADQAARSAAAWAAKGASAALVLTATLANEGEPVRVVVRGARVKEVEEDEGEEGGEEATAAAA